MQLMKTRQQGLTLVESMIALLVISVGLLGIAALQLTSVQQNATALNHSKAVWISYEMADRIRANISEFENYAGIDTNDSYSQDCMGGTCTTEQMIESDAADWATQMQVLPGGRGMITGDATQLTLSVMWDDDGTGATGTGCGNDPEVDLTCFTITMIQ